VAGNASLGSLEIEIRDPPDRLYQLFTSSPKNAAKGSAMQPLHQLSPSRAISIRTRAVDIKHGWIDLGPRPQRPDVPDAIDLE